MAKLTARLAAIEARVDELWRRGRPRWQPPYVEVYPDYGAGGDGQLRPEDQAKVDAIVQEYEAAGYSAERGDGPAVIVVRWPWQSQEEMEADCG